MEDSAIILDFLAYGYPLEKKMLPLAQAIGELKFTLLQLVPRRGVKLEIGEKVYIGEDKREKIQYILGRCPREKLTETALGQLKEFVSSKMGTQEERIVKFFNEAQPINTRLHQFELLPGFGKKHTAAIIAARDEKLFESVEDIKTRVTSMPDPIRGVEKRIIEELTSIQRYNLFIN
jgi:putative nucleotide binding protein